VLKPFSLKNIRAALRFRGKGQPEDTKPRRPYEPVLPRDLGSRSETSSQGPITLNPDPHGINKV
jgi:hypothetical protein